MQPFPDTVRLFGDGLQFLVDDPSYIEHSLRETGIRFCRGLFRQLVFSFDLVIHASSFSHDVRNATSGYPIGLLSNGLKQFEKNLGTNYR